MDVLQYVPYAFKYHLCKSIKILIPAKTGIQHFSVLSSSSMPASKRGLLPAVFVCVFVCFVAQQKLSKMQVSKQVLNFSHERKSKPGLSAATYCILNVLPGGNNSASALFISTQLRYEMEWFPFTPSILQPLYFCVFVAVVVFLYSLPFSFPHINTLYLSISQTQWAAVVSRGDNGII